MPYFEEVRNGFFLIIEIHRLNSQSQQLFFPHLGEQKKIWYISLISYVYMRTRHQPAVERPVCAAILCYTAPFNQTFCTIQSFF